MNAKRQCRLRTTLPGLLLFGLLPSLLLLPQAGLAESAGATAPATSMVGVWLTEDDKSRIAVEACGDRLCGRIVWLKPRDDGGEGPLLDSNNSDPAQRQRPLLGLQIMTGFRRADVNQWSDGAIYNPDDGRTYEPTFTLREDGLLEVEACILFICQSQAWRRVE